MSEDIKETIVERVIYEQRRPSNRDEVSPPPNLITRAGFATVRMSDGYVAICITDQAGIAKAWVTLSFFKDRFVVSHEVSGDPREPNRFDAFTLKQEII